MSSTGYLQINTALTLGKPLGGVKIQITNTVDHRVIEELVTDSSGKTPLLALSTPPIEYSQSVSMPKPYGEYGARVVQEDFDPASISGIQVLPDTVALQDILLTPKNGIATAGTNIVISPHTLLGGYPQKLPEESVKELPPSTGYIVLPEPVIPEFIIVHQGRPNEAGVNHWVKFKDYIKNVASSEIYATWPESTIQANVLAILSFTLNRVYTEWYRGKGYDFTITNSTAFDHFYVHGRNIYQQISVIVDSLFSSFLTKPGIKQPLLTQYCDGKQVSCPTWMTQWGSRDLGAQGYPAMDILRSFYGHDLYMEQAKSVQGVPASFPGYNIGVGASGPDIRTIQSQINAIAGNFPAIPKVRVDGLYGESTKNAVAKFQSIFDLPANGVVDFPTWYKLSDIYVAVTKMAELQ